MKQIIAGIVFAAIFVDCGGAGEIEYILNQHSHVTISIEGGEVVIKNKDGTLIFEGGISRRTEEIGGTAHFFDKKCGSFPYTVEGSFLAGPGTVLKLKGLAPVISKQCHVIGYTSKGPNANLVFTGLE